MKEEPKPISISEYRDRYITERADGTFTVSNMIYHSFEEAKKAVDKIISFTPKLK